MEGGGGEKTKQKKIMQGKMPRKKLLLRRR